MNQPPTGQPPYPPQQGGYGPPTGIPPPPPPEDFQPEKPMSGMAIASFITSLVGGLLTSISFKIACCVIFAPSILVGLILGFIAIPKTTKSGTRRGLGFAIAGIAIAVLSIIGGAIGIVWQVQKAKQGFQQMNQESQRMVTTDFELIRDRMSEYANANGGLTPGGPILSKRTTESANELSHLPRVSGSLRIGHLVSEQDLGLGMYESYSLRVTGQNTAVVEYRDWSGTQVATMTITDAKRGISNIVFHDN